MLSVRKLSVKESAQGDTASGSLDPQGVITTPFNQLRIRTRSDEQVLQEMDMLATGAVRKSMKLGATSEIQL